LFAAARVFKNAQLRAFCATMTYFGGQKIQVAAGYQRRKALIKMGAFS
jgi:hypothetical protein